MCLIEEEEEELTNEEENTPFNMEGFASGTQFREAQRREPAFQAIWETNIAQREQ